MARRLVKAVRDTDTVSRLGGDEFVIIMRHVTDLQELDAAINERLIASIRKPMQIDGHTLSVSCSVGVAVCPRDGHTEEELMRRADAAMYEAKSGGRDMARYFSPEALYAFRGLTSGEQKAGSARLLGRVVGCCAGTQRRPGRGRVFPGKSPCVGAARSAAVTKNPPSC